MLGSRLAAAGAAYLVDAVVKGNIPRDSSSAALLGAGALGAVVLAAPNAFRAAGVFKATSPGTVSLLDGVAQALGRMISAPKQAKRAAFQSAVQDELRAYGPVLAGMAAQQILNKTNMDGLTPEQLGQAARQSPQTPPPDAGGGPDDSAQVTGTATASVAPGTSIAEEGAAPAEGAAAIAATGGNQ